MFIHGVVSLKMGKVCVSVITVLTFGTVLSVIGRFAPGLFRGEGYLSVSEGKVVNASGSMSYYYYHLCDEGTNDCYLRTMHERYEDLKTIHGMFLKLWLIGRVGELAIDAIALINNILGFVVCVAAYSIISRPQALRIVAASLLLISGTLQLTNLGSVIAEAKAYNSDPTLSSKMLFPYSIPLIVIGSACILATSLVLYFTVIVLLFRKENERLRFVSDNSTNLLYAMQAVTYRPVSSDTVLVDSTYNQNQTSDLTNIEKTSL